MGSSQGRPSERCGRTQCAHGAVELALVCSGAWLEGGMQAWGAEPPSPAGPSKQESCSQEEP